MSKLEKALAEAGWKVVGKQDGELTVSLVPLRKVEKREVQIQLWLAEKDNPSHLDDLLDINLKLTLTQAEKVAAFLEAGMEHITSEPKSVYVESKHNPDFVRKAEEAREALEGTNEL